MADAMLPGESSLQYYLRQGMDPNSASAALAGVATGNGSPSQAAVQAQNQAIIKGYDARNQAINNGVVQRDWFGNNVNDKNSPYYSGPVNTGPRVVQSPLDAAFYGGMGADAVTSAARGNVSGGGVPTGSYEVSGGWGNLKQGAFVPNPTPAPYTGQYYSAARGDSASAYNTAYNNAAGPAGTATQGQPGTAAPNQPGTTWDGNLKNLPAMNQGESSQGYMQRLGLSDQTISYAQALSKANPGASFQDIMSYIQSKQGVTNPASTATQSSGLPPIQANETSQAYMKRIGMNDNAISYATALAKANPGASFQQIMAYMQQLALSRGSTQNQSPAAAAQQQEAARQAAWAQYYAAQAQKGGNLSQSGNIRYGETPVLTLPQG